MSASGPRKDRAWFVEPLFASCGSPEQVVELSEAAKKRRLLDFYVFPGRIGVKIQDEATTLHRVELVAEPLADSEWAKLFDALAERALFLAKLLSGVFPPEIAALWDAQGVPLFPQIGEGLKVNYNGAEIRELNPYAALLLTKLVERIEEDPFTLFTFRGRGKDETLLEIRSRRERRRGEVAHTELPVDAPLEPRAFVGLPTDPEKFWRSGSELADLSYTIRADELPASLFKRLDSIPLSGLEEDADALIEGAYEVVARRAQAYGLGLK